ncbi:cation diffusion facilitator family transporter [Paenibacillus oleatilyticus]|uniref:cation diffusion facilitator family transporter n=1 Tax=Paenibacillus oleatilyticus TaxID=2594886 RepID=UPI001C1FF9F4|nr:cation diffusion facilitator family transporter [Paenibacillus oleatilyticus]MBU7318118.1 cation diffusion facilitator family transporter [Paenibacillus oleatilyticus]
MGKGNNASIAAVWISLISNIVLTLLKLAVGFLSGSQVLLADGVHNAGDVIATAAALSSMRISKRPADEDHPYGHGKAEVLGSAFVAIVLAIAALFIGYHAAAALFEEPAEASVLALSAALVSLAWKQALYMYTIRIGRQTNSKGLIATAYDHLADVYASLAAVVGIALAMLGEAWSIPYLAYGDPLAGIIVSILVLKLAYSMGQEAFDVLMEKAVKPEKLGEYAALIQAIPQVKRIDRLRAREHGHYILVDLRVSIPGELTVQEGHDISRQIKRAIMERHADVDEVLIHLNPWYE